MLDLITSGEAGIILGCSSQTVNRWTEAGILTPIGRIGKMRTRVFDRTTVEKLAQKQRKAK